jgi:hypothetical protein
VITAKRVDDLFTVVCIALIVAEVWLPGLCFWWFGISAALAVLWFAIYLKEDFR